MRRELELAWAAGFFDGEGWSGCVQTRTTRRLDVVVGQVNRENLERFRSAVGDLGRIRGPNARGIHRFVASGGEAQRVVMSLWPYLGEEKRDQALHALLAYVFRLIRPADRCRRGHLYELHPPYVDPRGRRECSVCRGGRRHGALSPVNVRAIDVRLGVREYIPS